MAAENEILLFDENDDQVGTAYSNTELDAAIAAAESGYRIELGAGTFAASGQLSLDAAGISLVGAGDGTTTIQTANVSWGIYVTGDDVTISDLSVDAALTQNFGIKVNPADGDPAASLSGLEISNVTVSGAQRSEIDLNGVDDSTLSNVTANGNGTAGVGIALSDSTGITLENIATTGNAWGSIGLYSAGRNWEPGTNGITFAGTYTHDEPTGIYADEEDGSSVSNIDLSAIFGTVYKVENDTFRADVDQRSDDFTFFFGTEAEATAFALGLPAGPSDSVISTSATESPSSAGTETGETFVIAPGMSLQEAVDKAGAGDTILLRAGAYAESVTIPADKAGLTIEGPQVGVAGTDAARAPGSATDEASLEGRIVVLANGVTIDGVRMTEGADGGAFDLAAIHVQAENVTVQNSVFFRSGEADGDTSRGVINSVRGGDGLSVTQNAFTGFHIGTYVQGADGVTVAGNDYSGNFVGVSADAYTSGSANLSVTGNSFDNVLEDMGIGAVGGASWTGDISGNTFARGFFDYDPADNADLIGINIYVPGAVSVSGSDSVYTSIQDAVAAAAPGATITVGAGTYEEDVVIDKSVTLVSADGAEATVIDGQGGAPGAITIAPNAGAVAIGTTGTDGFTVLGNDGTAAVENAAIYLDGAQDGVSIVGNVIEARGDASLLSEYNAAVTNLTIDGNAITGQTFTGSEPAGNGFSEQFSLDNVPRQLVTIGGGDNTDAVTFVNNTVSGTAGGLNAAGEPQGNTLVTIDASNSLISDNDFTGFTNRYATALRVRKDGTEISNNTFDASASGSPNTAYVYVSTDNPGPATNNTFVAFDGGQQLGGIGDDIFTGGPGDDTVVYNGNRADFAITFTTDAEGRIDGARAVVDTNVEDGDEGSDSLSGIETLQFADASIGFDDPIRVIRGGELIASFETLQAAVDGATEGDTILVGDGIYGPVSIDKSIALYAMNDGGAQIVGAGVNQGAAIRIEAGVSDVVIGAPGQGFEIDAVAGDLAAVYAVGSNTGIDLSGNDIDGGTGRALLGGGTGGTGLSGLTVAFNTLSSTGPTQTVYVNGATSLSGVTSGSGNSFIGNTLSGDNLLMGLESEGDTVSGNTFTGAPGYTALELWGAGSTVAENAFDLAVGDAEGESVSLTAFVDGAGAYDEAQIAAGNTAPEGAAYAVITGDTLVYADDAEAAAAAAGADGAAIELATGNLAVFNGMSIQAAVDVAEPGATIVVGAGVYTEDVVVDTTVTLLGANAGTPITVPALEGPTPEGARAPESMIDGSIRFAQDADGSTLDGMAVIGGGTALGTTFGIYVQAADVTVANSVLAGATEGGYAPGRGIITGTGDGAGLTVTGNGIGGWATGVYANPGSDATISGNVFVGNNVGVSSDGPDVAAINGNAFIGQFFEHIGIGVLPGTGDVDLSGVISGNSFEDALPFFEEMEPIEVQNEPVATKDPEEREVNEVSIYALGSGTDRTLVGTEAQDVFFGNAGDETIAGLEGDDLIAAGAGDDTVIVSGFAAGAAITFDEAAGNATVITAVGGADTLSGVENLAFDDETVSIVTGADEAATDEDSATTGTVLDNDFDLALGQGDLTVIEVEGTAIGSGAILLASGALVTMAADGSYAYDTSGAFEDLDEGETVTDSFAYTVVDGDGNATVESVTVKITGQNDAPVLGDASTEVQEDDGAAVVASLAALTSDVDGDDDPAANVTYAVTGVTGGGAASIDGTDLVFDTAGDFETLAAGETEEVTVEVTATDDSGAADTATITVTVTGENDAPVLEDQEVAVQEDGPVASIDLKTLASDVDDGVVLSYALVGDAPARGTFTLEDGVVAFDPSGDFEDLDDGETVQVEVGVEVSDGEGGVITRTVTFTVNGANDAPVLDDQALAASEDDGSASIDLGALATDVDGDALSYTYEAADGFVLPVPVAGNGTGVLTFDGFDTAPVQSLNAGETLEQVVNVTVSDGDVTDTATVTLTLTGENDVPTVAAGSGDAVEDGAGISVDLAALGDDVDDEDTGASLSYAITTEPGAGSASIDGTSLLFAPGSDFQALKAGEETTVEIGITATDARGAQSAEQVVTITVTGENDAPTLFDLETVLGSVAEDGPAAGFDFASLALANDADAEDDATTLTYAVQLVLLDGTEIDLSAASFDGSTLTVDPSSLADILDAGETGTLAVEVLVTDAQGAEATRTYMVDVTGANDAPVIGDASAEVQEDDGAAVIARLAALTSDVDGDDDPAANVTYVVTGVTGGGAASIDGNDLVFDTAGDFETLAAGETEEVTVEVTATDDSGAADTATITVTVTGENDAPVLEEQSLDADEDGEAVSLDLAALASDVDGTDTLTFALAAMPARGLVTLADGVIAFDPNGDFEDLDAGETDTVVAEVTVSDGTETITRTVSFTVTGQHDASGVVRIGSSEADFLSGTDGNDRLDSGAGDDDLSGGAGADGLIGRQGNDTLDGGDGDDNIAAGEGDDFVFGGGGDDAIGGGAGSDNIDAGEGNDTIGGGFDDDTIIAGAGDDLVAGGAGKDFIAAGSGDDVVSGSFGTDTLFGGAGNDDLGGGFGMDTLSAGLGDDSVGGGNGDDLINGGAGNDFLAGGGRNDRINGGVGDDTINGGNGSDELIGGSGSDLFVFNAPDPSQTDTIFDFEVGSDQILLIGVENVPGSGLEGRLEALEMTHTMYGVGADAVESVVLSYEGQEIVIVGVAAEDLTLEDISFL